MLKLRPRPPSKCLAAICCLCALSLAADFGRITKLEGEVSLTRNLEQIQPVIASRIYARDLLLLGSDALVQIEGTRGVWTARGPALVEAVDTTAERRRFSAEYGTLTYRRRRSELRHLPLSIGYTLIFPGWGHYYIEDHLKALPMFAASALLLSGIFSNNPERSSQPEAVSQTRESYQQIYLVYLILAVMDVWSETNSIRKDLLDTAERAGRN
jgi:hypothetical protein